MSASKVVVRCLVVFGLPLLLVAGCERSPFAKRYAMDFDNLLAESNWRTTVTFSQTNVGINAHSTLSGQVLTLQGERNNAPRPWITARHTFEPGVVTEQLRELQPACASGLANMLRREERAEGLDRPWPWPGPLRRAWSHRAG